MDRNNSEKMATTKAPQLSEIETSAKTNSARSPVERHLGLIKLMAIIMAVLIVAALATIIVTIYGRLTVVEEAKTIQENELIIPVNSRVASASLAENGQILLIVQSATGQQIWQVDAAGKVRRKTRIIQSQ
jgi:hypothetical protein